MTSLSSVTLFLKSPSNKTSLLSLTEMSFRSLPDYGLNDNLGGPTDGKNDTTSTSKPSSTSPPTSNSEGDSDHPVDIITTLGVYPETKELVEEHLIKLGKQIEQEEPDCLQWEVFYLSATGELVLIERSVGHFALIPTYLLTLPNMRRRLIK